MMASSSLDALGKVTCPPSPATITQFRPSGIKALTPSPVPGPMIPIGPAAVGVLGPTGNTSAPGRWGTAIAVAAKSLTTFSDPSPRLRCSSLIENDQPRFVSATWSPLAEAAELERSELVQNRPGSPAEVRHASHRNEGSRL